MQGVMGTKALSSVKEANTRNPYCTKTTQYTYFKDEISNRACKTSWHENITYRNILSSSDFYTKYIFGFSRTRVRISSFLPSKTQDVFLMPAQPSDQRWFQRSWPCAYWGTWRSPAQSQQECWRRAWGAGNQWCAMLSNTCLINRWGISVIFG